MAITWNPSDKGSSVGLSNGDLTCENIVSTSMHSVRATASKSSGKWYWEIIVDYYDSYPTTGIGNAAATITNYPGSDVNGYGYRSNGQKYNSGSGVAFGSTYTTGDIIGIALDLTAGKIWFAKNNAWQASGDPANGTNEAFSGISGTFFPMQNPRGYDAVHPTEITGRFASAHQSYAPPSGFSSLDSGTAINLFDGKISINSPITLFDGKLKVKNDATDLFDGKLRIKSDATDLFDGKLKVTVITSDLFDGKLKVKNDATNLFDGKLKVRNDTINLFDGRLIATHTGQISASCPTPSGQFIIGKRLAGSVATPSGNFAAVFRYARFDADVPVPTANFKVGRIIEGDLPVPCFTCTANIGRNPSLIANTPCPICSMRVGLSLSDIATISQKAGVPVPGCCMVADTSHLTTMYGVVPCPLFTCDADTENITIISAPVPCPTGLFETTVGNVASIFGRVSCPSGSLVALTGQVIFLTGNVPVPGSLVRFMASLKNDTITLVGTVPTPTIISRVHGLRSSVLRHIRGEVR